MKFGETLYQRSVPKWAAYNVKYNELKSLIKQRTSAGSSLPITIPTAANSKWHDLETELYPIIKREYDDVSLFLRSKQGEIDRRLSHLEKQVNAALRAVASTDVDRPITQARKYQRLVKDADAIGDEIESLSRFAAVQKTAFRKILKKYRKWTGSTTLQEHLEQDVFSTGALHLDYAQYLERLSKLSMTISNKLQGPMLTGAGAIKPRGRSGRTLSQSNAKTISDLCNMGSLHLDAALDNVHYGESGGSAHFWIHPEYLDQAEALLLRHMRPHARPSSSRQSPNHSSVDLTNDTATSDVTCQAIFDNAQRFARDETAIKPSRAALVARWNAEPGSVISYSSLAPNSEETTTVSLKRKYLTSTLGRSSQPTADSVGQAKDVNKIKDYLSEHRDVKPLAIIHSNRARFTGPNNTKDVGTWATLDGALLFARPNESNIGQMERPVDGSAFPHAILHIRWEFTRLPEIVRVLEASHLAERVHQFSLESAAIFSVHKDLPQPSWKQLLASDIRRMPVVLQKKGSISGRRKEFQLKADVVPSSSGPSSTGDSVFSAGQGQSSATDVDLSPTASGTAGEIVIESKTKALPAVNGKTRKQKSKPAKLFRPPRVETPQRYWNEFDDGDSDTHVEERYAIYVDPDEPSFPGAEMVSKVFGGMYDSLSKGRQRIVSWLPLSSNDGASSPNAERTPLLFGRQNSQDASVESSGDETEEDFHSKTPSRRRRGTFSRTPWARSRALSKREKARERSLQLAYMGLLLLAYLLIVMSGILLGSGRKKKQLQVDAGVITGVVAAWACAGTSMMLICMRRQSLGPVHWGLVSVNVAVVVVIGVGQMILMLGNSL